MSTVPGVSTAARQGADVKAKRHDQRLCWKPISKPRRTQVITIVLGMPSRPVALQRQRSLPQFSLCRQTCRPCVTDLWVKRKTCQWKTGLNTFLIRELTTKNPMPTHDLRWTEKIFQASPNGTLVMSTNNNFRYLLPELSPYSKLML